MTKKGGQKKKGNNAKANGGEGSNNLKPSAGAEAADIANGKPVVAENDVDSVPTPAEPVKHADGAATKLSQAKTSAPTNTSNANQKQDQQPHANGSSKPHAPAAKQARASAPEGHHDESAISTTSIDHKLLDGPTDTAGLLKARAHLISSVNLLEESLRACRSREVAEAAAMTSLMQENIKLKESRSLAAVVGFGSGVTVAAVLATAALVFLRSRSSSYAS
eukprot:jgi/Mesvir1/29098/Mv18404-RA.1